MKKCLPILVIWVLFCCDCDKLHAKSLKVVVNEVPGLAWADDQGVYRGGFMELVSAIDEAYKAGSIDIVGVFPFKRSIIMLKKGAADFCLPLIKTKQGNPIKGLLFSSEPIGFHQTVLYSRADRPGLDLDHLYQYKIDVIRGHKPLTLNRHGGEVSSVESGLLKVMGGRSDGFIISQDEGDAYIREHKIKTLRRQLHSRVPIHLVMKGGPGSKSLDAVLSGIIQELRVSGKLNEIMDKIHKPFFDWQPYEMDW